VAHTALHRHKGLKGLLSGDLAARAISDPDTGKALACLRQRARQVQQPVGASESTLEESPFGSRLSSILSKVAQGLPEKPHVETVAKFIETVRARLASVTNVSAPFSPAFSEIGYTNNAERRLKDHRSHRSSNRLMNLYEAAAHVLYPYRFRIRQYVLYLI
jgi:hypothetical protein